MPHDLVRIPTFEPFRFDELAALQRFPFFSVEIIDLTSPLLVAVSSIAMPRDQNQTTLPAKEATGTLTSYRTAESKGFSLCRVFGREAFPIPQVHD